MRRTSLAGALMLACGGLVTLGGPATAVYVPRTLTTTVPVIAQGVVDPSFAVDFVSVRWDGAHGVASVRLRHGQQWGAWEVLPEDGVHVDGLYLTAPFAADDADAVQVRVPRGVHGARVTVMNTSDGELVRVANRRGASAATPVVSRAQWGADESLRYDGSTEKFPPVYYAVQKITLHHTATGDGGSDPAAVVRAIYATHAAEFGDIGYHYLVGPGGQVFEGRWSGTDGDPAHDATGKLVTAAHVAGQNSGNLGIAVLGDFTTGVPTTAARSSLESLLGDQTARHGLDPQGSSDFVNPVNGSVKPAMPNISGHRDWAATECPGDQFYAQLPAIRAAVAARPPVISVVRAESVTRSSAVIRWTTNEAATGRVEYWTTGAATRTPTVTTLSTQHKIQLRYLRKATRYSYRVRSRDVSGVTATSAVKTFTTPR